MILPDCAYRHPVPRQAERWFCQHPRVTVPGGVVNRMLCRGCCCAATEIDVPPRSFPRELLAPEEVPPCLFRGDRFDGAADTFTCHHACHVTTDLEQCRLCPDYAQRLTRGAVTTWSVGITTAPRRRPTLARTLESLCTAGWDDCQLFAEPGSEIPQGVPSDVVTWRSRRMGAFSNWYLALMELVLRMPHADAYFLCQDDVLFSRDLRRYLEQVLWPQESLGVVSVYCAGVHDPGGPPRFVPIDSGWATCGALALIFPNAVAKGVLNDPQFLRHRSSGPYEGDYNIDSVLGRWCHESGLAFVTHTPSLAQHIGTTSTLFRATHEAQTPQLFANSFDPDYVVMTHGLAVTSTTDSTRPSLTQEN